ncbi:hypothetical protein D3C86_1354700 [compost metagenome]
MRATVGRRRLFGSVGVVPAGREAVGVDRKPAFGETVGHRRRRVACSFARRRLGRLLRRDGLCREVQVADRTLQLCIRLLLLQPRVREARRRHAVRQAPALDRAGLRRALVGEPGGAEGLARLRHAHRPRGGQCHGQRTRQRREAQLALGRNGASARRMGVRIQDHDERERNGAKGETAGSNAAREPGRRADTWMSFAARAIDGNRGTGNGRVWQAAGNSNCHSARASRQARACAALRAHQPASACASASLPCRRFRRTTQASASSLRRVS